MFVIGKMKKVLITLFSIVALIPQATSIYATTINQTYDLGDIPFVAIEGYHSNWETNEFGTPSLQLGHLIWWADLCFYRPKNGSKSIKNLKVDFLDLAIGKDRAEFRFASSTRQSNAPHHGINCNKDVAADIYALFTNVISWQERNPGSSVPKLSKFWGDNHPTKPDKPEKQPSTEVVEQQTPTQENDPLARAKAFCSDLGFTSGTEKHGTCVLKIASNLSSEVAPAKNEPETASDKNKPPTITIASASSDGPQGTVRGRVTDNTGVAEVRVDGELVQTDSYGNFTASTYVPEGGVSVSIEALDLAGLSSSMSIRLDRSSSTTKASITFERLNPLGRKVAKNKDALALIIGVDGYKSTPGRAIYADNDAKVFTDYASQKLGIPTNRVKTLVNDGAGEQEMLLSVKSWLARISKQGKTDVYVFFAGHGLASDDGQKMYLLPYDGAPELLDDTAILRDRLFSDISAANPRSVTVFLDTCYSGTTRGTDMLIASRPIAIRALEQSVPDNFTVMTAAAGDQTAKPLEEAKHGMFSYFLMKGMEGDADANNDNQITAGELHEYVERNVVQQSSGSQTPELQGDANRVLVRFQ